MNVVPINQPNNVVSYNKFNKQYLKAVEQPISKDSDLTFKALPKNLKRLPTESKNISSICHGALGAFGIYVILDLIKNEGKHPSIAEVLSIMGDSLASSANGVTYESYISEGANIEKTTINKINRIANNAISQIINKATAESRELDELDYKRIDMVKANQKQLIEVLNSKAKQFKKNDFIKLRENSFTDNAYIHFGTNIENEIFVAETFKVATAERGSGFYDYSSLAKNYATKLGIKNYSISDNLFNSKEMLLEAWLKAIEDVDPKSLKLLSRYEIFIQNNITNKKSCNAKEYERLKKIVLHITDGEYQESLLNKLNSNLNAHKKGLDIAIKNEKIKKDLLG